MPQHIYRNTRPTAIKQKGNHHPALVQKKTCCPPFTNAHKQAGHSYESPAVLIFILSDSYTRLHLQARLIVCRARLGLFAIFVNASFWVGYVERSSCSCNDEPRGKIVLYTPVLNCCRCCSRLPSSRCYSISLCAAGQQKHRYTTTHNSEKNSNKNGKRNV